MRNSRFIAHTSSVRPDAPPGARRRDWVQLPLIGLATMAAILGMTELAGRMLFSEGSAGDRACLILDDPKRGVTAIPHSVCREKIPESGWVEYRFNSCGHRDRLECGSKAAGTYRIVLIGSSYVEGYSVSREQSFAGLLPGLLQKSLGCRVEVYNEGLQWGTAHAFDLRFDEVLSAQPDLILWPVTPWDIANGVLTVAPAASVDNPTPSRSGVRAMLKRNLRRLLESKAAFLMRHFLYESESLYVKAAASDNEESSAALAVVPSKRWKGKLQQFSGYMADMESRAKRANLPFVVVALPSHAQADMISAGIARPSMDPYVFSTQLRAIAERDHAIYLDLLPLFREIPDAHKYFYAVNEHANAMGHAGFARMLAKALSEKGVLKSRRAHGNNTAGCENGFQ